MSKSNTQTLILPGETGWEIWSCPGSGAFELQHATDFLHAGELESIPNGELTMLFALRSITAVPLRVMTTEEEMFDDLAALHAERLGLRANPLAGQLDDLFEVEREEESTVLLSVWLKPPGEGDMPKVGPKAFDLSARAIPVEGSAISVWRELGRWVFAIHQSGKLLYAQASADSSPSPDAALARELKLALMQLSMQGLDPKPEQILVWTADTALDTSALREAFELPVEIHARPQPMIPQPPSKLLPEDVRAARQVAQRRQRIQLGVGAVVAFYVILILWLAYGLWQDNRSIKDLKAQADLAAPEVQAYEDHMQKWRELADAVDIDHYPVEIMDRINSCIPKNQGLRLTSAEVSSSKILLVGTAPNEGVANQFGQKLENNASLSRYQWSTPFADPDSLGVKFRYQGDVVSGSGAP